MVCTAGMDVSQNTIVLPLQVCLLQNPSQYSQDVVCMLSTVAPIITSFTFNTTENSQECVLKQGESLHLVCKSEGFPIISSIAIKHSDGQEKCASVNSSANLTLVGHKEYGQLDHTCEMQDLQPGLHEMSCQVNFLPWGNCLKEFEGVEEVIQCNVMPGKKVIFTLL